MNIVTFPLNIQMERIRREAIRLEKKSYELLKKYKKSGHSMTLDGMKDGIGSRTSKDR
tara:strand:+ start:268 stop:441 length:174 start_codon:yes stop_codon:yes gene_type:complete